MATSGTVYSSYAKSSRLYVSWSQTGQSIPNNNTTIKWTAGIVVGGGNKWYSNAIKITSVYVNGVKVSSGGTYSNLTSNGTYSKLSGTATIPHYSDGTKSFSISIAGWFYDIGNKSGSGSYTLTTIPRVSDISVDKTSIPIDGSTKITVTTNKKSTSFVDTIVVKLNDTYQKTDVVSGTAFAIPTNWKNGITTTVSATVTATVTTKSGSTTIGSKSTTFTVTVPETIKPSVTSVTATEANTTTKTNFGVFVKGLSKLNVTVASAGKDGSTIKTINSTFNGTTFKTASYQTETINKSGSLKISTLVTDSRGRNSDIKETTITVYDYFYPVVSGVSCKSEGTGTKVTVIGNVAPVTVSGTAKNTKSLVISYRKAGTSTWTAGVTVTPSAWNFTYSKTFTIDSSTSTYEFKAELKDKMKTVTEFGTTGIPVISRLAGGKGVTLLGEAKNEGFWVGNVDYTITDAEYDELLKLVGG